MNRLDIDRYQVDVGPTAFRYEMRRWADMGRLDSYTRPETVFLGLFRPKASTLGFKSAHVGLGENQMDEQPTES